MAKKQNPWRAPTQAEITPNVAFDPILQQQEGIQNLQDMAQIYAENASGGVDISPLAALADAWTGSNLARSYRAPASYQDQAAKLGEFAQKIQGERANLAKMFNQREDNQLEKRYKEAQIRKLEAETGKLGGIGGVNRDLLVPGVGEALTEQDAKDLKEASVQKQKFDRQVQEMIELRKKYGGEVLNRAAVARGKQLSKDLLLTYKNLQKLGVLSANDESIINAIIPADPLEFVSPLGKDPVMGKLTSFKGDSDKDYDANVKARTLRRFAQESPKAPPGGLTEAEIIEMQQLEALEKAGKI